MRQLEMSTLINHFDTTDYCYFFRYYGYIQIHDLMFDFPKICVKFCDGFGREQRRVQEDNANQF